MFLRLLIYVVAGVLVYRAVKKWFGGSSGPGKVQGRDNVSLRADDLMVQDPQCGVYLAKHDGVSLIDGDGEHYFCSEACKEKYLAQRKGKR